jgi:hypothetical protein
MGEGFHGKPRVVCGLFVVLCTSGMVEVRRVLGCNLTGTNVGQVENNLRGRVAVWRTRPGCALERLSSRVCQFPRRRAHLSVSPPSPMLIEFLANFSSNRSREGSQAALLVAIIRRFRRHLDTPSLSVLSHLVALVQLVSTGPLC